MVTLFYLLTLAVIGQDPSTSASIATYACPALPPPGRLQQVTQRAAHWQRYAGQWAVRLHSTADHCGVAAGLQLQFLLKKAACHQAPHVHRPSRCWPAAGTAKLADVGFSREKLNTWISGLGCQQVGTFAWQASLLLIPLPAATPRDPSACAAGCLAGSHLVSCASAAPAARLHWSRPHASFELRGALPSMLRVQGGAGDPACTESGPEGGHLLVRRAHLGATAAALLQGSCLSGLLRGPRQAAPVPSHARQPSRIPVRPACACE